MDWKLQYCKILPKLIYRFISTPIKIQTGVFTGLYRLIEIQRAKNNGSILKENKIEGFILLTIKAYFKAIN